MTVALDPEGLGTVRATVTVNGGDVTVHLTAETPEGHQALARNLADLQQQLERDGGRASVSLQSESGGQGSGGGASTAGGGGGGQDDDEPAEQGAVTPPGAGAGRLVDLRL